MQWINHSSAADNIFQRHYRNLVSCDQQYNDNNLHLHANSWPVCKHHYIDSYDQPEGNTKLCSGRSVLQWINYSSFTDNIHQRYYWNLGTCNQQYNDKNLHLYTGTRPFLCKHDHTDDYNQPEGNTKLCSSRSLLQWITYSRFADNIHQRHHWNLVSSDKQYRYDDLHLYADSWPVCELYHTYDYN